MYTVRRYRRANDSDKPADTMRTTWFSYATACVAGLEYVGYGDHGYIWVDELNEHHIKGSRPCECAMLAALAGETGIK